MDRRDKNAVITAVSLTQGLGHHRDWNVKLVSDKGADGGLCSAGLQVEFINPIFEFSRAMRRLGLDDAEYALLIAINIFSADRPNVQEPSRVEELQQPYVEALLSYTRIKRPQVLAAPLGKYLVRGGGVSSPTRVIPASAYPTVTVLSFSALFLL